VITIRSNRSDVQHFYIWATDCIYVFRVDLRTNSHWDVQLKRREFTARCKINL